VAIHKLTARAVETRKRPGRYGDGGGLWLQVSRWKGKVNKSWLFQFTAGNGKVRQFGLGPLHTVSLEEARKRATQARLQVLDGKDPIEAKQQTRAQERQAAAQAVTFKECAEQYIAAHQASWKNETHRKQWKSTLRAYAYPVIGSQPVANITTPLVLKVLEPIWASKPETAVRVRGRIDKVLDFAKAREYREGENPARWTGHLDKLLPAPAKLRTVRHHPALPYAEVPAFMGELRNRKGISAQALEFCILTAARTSEVIGAKWNEIDLEAQEWTVPGTRMKGGREHRVPLSDRAVELLQALPPERDNPFVFIGGREGAPLSNMAMLEQLRELRPGLTVHGFRSTFRDWAAETTAFPNHVAEMALAHAIGDKVEAAYRRGVLFNKRRQLMSAWAKYCAQPPIAKADNVQRLRGPGAAP
jgi:integrase